MRRSSVALGGLATGGRSLLNTIPKGEKMKKASIGICIAFLAGAITLLANAQEYQPGKLFPVETVCKEDRDDITSLQGYVVIGETQDYRCSKTGNNAWKLKRLESGDIVCSVLYPYVLAGGPTPFSLTDYEVSNGFFANQCPQFDSWGWPVTTNAVTVSLKQAQNPTINANIPQGYVAVARVNGNQHAIEAINSSEYLSCATTSVPPGFMQQGEYFYRAACDPDNSFSPIHGRKLVAPSNSVLGIYSTGINASRAIPNYIATAFHLGSDPWLLLRDIKRAKENIEYACIIEGDFLPFGYYPTAQIYTEQCSDQKNSGNTKANTLVLKKIGAATETICKTRVYGNYFFSDGSPAVGYPIQVKIPVGYTKVSEFYSPDCYNNTGNTAPNAYEISRIN
jgi:hypothetical protein